MVSLYMSFWALAIPGKTTPLEPQIIGGDMNWGLVQNLDMRPLTSVFS